MVKKVNYYDIDIAKNILRVRLSQLIINEKYKNGEFKIPIHLALGHEAIAVAVDLIMESEDQLVLSHRNIHYHLARIRSLKPQIDEYLLRKDGLAKGQLGSMNLANEEKGIVYTSSILGNNLSVATGLALGKKVKSEEGIVIVVTGDGAIEEGSFYESLIFLKSHELPLLIIIENNEWSLATKINERRCDINLEKFADSLDIKYMKLSGNDPYQYIEELKKIRKYAIYHKTTVCIEVDITTIGSWTLKTEECLNGKFINYHAGPAPTISLTEWPIICESSKDPIFVLKNYFEEDALKKVSTELLQWLREDII